MRSRRRTSWGCGRRVVWIPLLLASTGGAVATEPARPAGSWPTRRQIGLILDRVTEEAARTFELDEQQRKAFRRKGERACVGLFGMKEATPSTQEVAASADEAEHTYWPTSDQIGMIVDQSVAGSVRIYGLDGHQREVFRKRSKTALVAFAEKHKQALEPVFAEVLAHRIAGKVPTTQRVAGWSQKLLPVAQDFQAEWDAGYRRMLSHLRPEQRAKWRRDYAVFKVGCAMGTAKLRGWAQGGFRQAEWSKPFPGPHLGPDNVLAQAKKEGVDTTPSSSVMGPVVDLRNRPSPATLAPGNRLSSRIQSTPSNDGYVPLDRWQSYTKQFVKRYHLDEGQATAAMAILKEMRQRADNYRRGHGKEFARLGKELHASKGDERERVRAELVALEGPLQALFDELRDRLDNLLDESQRAPSGAER